MLEACPSFEGRQSAVQHPRTIIGTLSHAAIETGEDNPELTDEDADKVAECIDFYDERKAVLEANRQEAVLEAMGRLENSLVQHDKEAAKIWAERSVPQIQEIKELYLPVDDLLFDDGVKHTTAGYCDSAIIAHTGKYAEMFDWKLGIWPVQSAKGNLQGISYVIGLFRQYPNLECIRFFFKQPNIKYLTVALFDRKDIPEHYLRVQVVVARAREARRKGDFSTAQMKTALCTFCKHLAVCPVVSKLACKVGSKFHPIEIPPDITPSRIHDPNDTTLGLRLAQLLGVWAGAYKKCIQERVIRGEAKEPEGYGLESRTPREIVDESKYKAVALRSMTEAEYATTLKPSLGKVEKIISDKAPRGQKKAEVEKFDQDIRAAGAVVDGDGYTFLRAKPSKPTE